MKFWASKDLKPSDFDQEALGKMICKHYKSGLTEEERKDFECTDAIKTDPANMYTPNDFKEFDETQKLLHYTLVFQVFVFMQLFNQINARKLEEDEFNVFAGFFNNGLFIFVVILTFVIQMVLVEVGQMAIKTHSLSIRHNLICIGFGSIELIWGVIIKFMPLRYFQLWSLDERPSTGEGGGISSTLKKSSTMRKKGSDSMRKKGSGATQ